VVASIFSAKLNVIASLWAALHSVAFGWKPLLIAVALTALPPSHAMASVSVVSVLVDWVVSPRLNFQGNYGLVESLQLSK
jgi:hypothetical protein